MKITRREFGKIAGVGAVLTWLPPLEAKAPSELCAKHDRWITEDRHVVYEGSENCWHPQLARTKKGELLLSFLLGDPPKTMLLRSKDAGQSWSTPQLVYDKFELEGGGGWGMAVLRSGRIVMSYLDISPWQKLPIWPPASEPRKIGMWPDKGLRPWGWTPATSKVMLRALYSDDDGHTWKITEPIDCKPYMAAISHGCGPIFESGSTVYMPVWAWRSKEYYSDCALLESKDGGKRWFMGTVIAQEDEAHNVQYREVAVHVLPNGEWLAICRANEPNYYGLLNVSMNASRSHDGGMSWSKPLATFVALGYPRMGLLPDGGLWAYGSYSEGLRDFFSYNGGNSWAYEDILYTRDSRQAKGTLDRGSASAVAVKEDRVLLTYYATKDQGQNFGKMISPINRVEGVWVRRVKNDAKEVLAR